MTADNRGKRRITALFDDRANAERAYLACVDRGYEIGDVNIVMSEATRTVLLASESEVGTEMAQHKAEGGELGGPKGGRIGILVTISAAVGAALLVPALGIAAAGPIAASLTAAGAAGLASGLIAALGDWGVPEDRVRHYEGGIRNGGILMMLETRSEEDARHIEQQWQALGARDLICS
jgi:hypothetical protein